MNSATASGRFVLRLDPELHGSLRSAAATQGVSLNEYCATKLAAPSLDVPFRSATDVLRRAAALLGDDLLGVLAFGSWARGELAESSDVDVLIVASLGFSLTRSLYRRWDEVPLDWQGHPVEPHFVHLPPPDREPSGLWAEVALDGIVLYQRDLQLSRWLARVRRLVAQRRIRCGTTHGQAYWIRE